ncbi:MAG: preprotein translocase subunit SecG [Phenylobacterium sp.]|jgi:preprotein translocase subunit SecG
MYEILLIVYLLVALSLVFMILIQQGKGADMGASFGAGSSNTLFGASGSGNFLTKMTTALAAGFFVLSIMLGNLTSSQTKQPDEWNDLAQPGDAVQTQPLAEDVPVSNIPVSDIPASEVPAAVDSKTSDVPAGDNK